MEDGIYKENDNYDNDDNDNEEQMLMQTPHYPPAETYCCWDVMVISRCPQTIITVTTFFYRFFPLFWLISRCPQTMFPETTFLLLFPLILGDLLMSPNEYYRNNFYRFSPLFWCFPGVAISIFFPWNLHILPQKNISVIPFFPSKPVIPFTCFPSLLVISLLIISTTSILIRKAFLSDFACTS